MKNLNRRQWLKLSTLTGAGTLLGGGQIIGKTTSNDWSQHRLESLNQMVRLSSNENPYGPSEKVRAAMVDAFDVACRYPGMFYKELVEMIAKESGVGTDEVLLTAGSMEGLRITGLTYGLNGGEIVSADPVFKSLLTYAENFGAYIHRVPVTADLQHDLEAMEKRITMATKLVFVCNPNNPTGTLLPANKFRDFCDSISHKAVVFSDEAYFDYITEPNYPSMIALVKEGKNVIVSRTFSKIYGLAGIRIGYLIARPDIIERLKKNVMAAPNVLAVFAAIEAMKDKAFYDFSLRKNEEAKAHLYETLKELNLFYHPSHTNFVFFKTGRNIEEVNHAIANQGVKIGRPFPPLTDWCRVSTGTMEEMEKLRGAMRAVFR
jgi:histidinol-phosphate aminotransferase